VLKYAYPFKDEDKERFDFYTTTYCYPYFYQDWRLFTPCPNYNFQIYASYDVNGMRTYAAPLQEVLEHKNLFNGGEFLKLSFTAAEGYLAYEANMQNAEIRYFPIGKNYFVLQTIVKNYLQHMHGAEIKDLKMLVVLKEIKNGQIKYLVDK
jgi:hypothetical protein